VQKVCVAVINKHCIANGTMDLSFIYQDLCHHMLLDYYMAVAVNGLRFATPIFAGNET
jgi:acyl dehydratase